MTDNPTPAQNIAETVADLTRRQERPFLVDTADGRQYALTPEGWNSTTLGRTYDDPMHHVHATPKHQTIDSFIAYLEQWAQFDTTVVYVNMASLSLSAIIDGHNANGDRGFEDHTATHTPIHTAEWHALKLNDWLDRDTFREMVYRLQAHITAPDAIDVLGLAEQFNVSTKTDFKAGEKLADGSRTLHLVEESQAAGGGAMNITIPAKIGFTLSLYIDSDPVNVDCFFRYRIHEGALELRLDHFELDTIKRDQFTAYAELVAGAIPDVKQITGAA